MAEGGACPAHSWLTNLVRLERAWFARSGEGQRTASLRCMARRPEGPGAVPVGKDRSAVLYQIEIITLMHVQVLLGPPDERRGTRLCWRVRTATGEAREVIHKIAIREWARLNFGGKIYRYNYYYV